MKDDQWLKNESSKCSLHVDTHNGKNIPFFSKKKLWDPNIDFMNKICC